MEETASNCWIFGIGQALILGITTWIAYQQWRTARRQKELDELRFQHELFDKRIAIYRATVEFTRKVVQNALVTIQDLYEFYGETAECDFLFKPEIRSYIDHLYETANSHLRQLPHNQNRSEQDTAALMFFYEQLRETKIKFEPYLKLYEERLP